MLDKFFILTILLSTTFFVISSSSSINDPLCEYIQNDERFECFPEYNASESECLQRGCCWQPPSQNLNNKRGKLSDDIPYCFYPSNFPNYNVVSSSNYIFSLQKDNATFRPNEILKLQVKIIPDTKNRLRVQITDPKNPSRYQVPTLDPENVGKENEKLNEQDYDFQIFVSESPFAIRIYRKSTGKLIFDTSVAPLIYADQYIEFSTSLPVNYFYGVGEHEDSLAHSTKWNTFTLWNRDGSPTVNTNLYGTHPFYLSLEEDNNAFGVFLVNSNGIDIKISPYPALTFIMIGGIIDFYIYMGPTPQDVIMQHTEIVGRSVFPQYFSLGFHLCRYNYSNSTHLKQVIRRNREINLPYDTQWTDIDAMYARLDWTFDNETFYDLPAIVQDLHDHDQHYINIIDPAISNTSGYFPYESGLKYDLFIKNSYNDEPLIGAVWPGYTVFPDFTNPYAKDWWAGLAASYHETIPFDGLWIDMNEPSNFVEGSINGCLRNNSYDYPPYVPRVLGETLFSKTICPASRQYLSNHYNLHNMYGHFESIATNHALKSIMPQKRPFVLTRSSFAGTGHYAAHWSGDNTATWDDLYYSIPIILNFNMFGVSFVGADVCGFIYDTTEELCIRWMQLGSFYPFMRNHNDAEYRDQDPAVFSKDAQEIMKKYLNMRYSLLPYLYTRFYRSNLYGETVVRPLFFEFTGDKNSHMIDRQFMFGPAFMISPVLDQGATTVNAYFPQTTWYKYETGEMVDNSQTSYITLDAPLNEINVHIRGGYVVPYQVPSVTTKASRRNPFGLVVALNYATNQSSFGDLFWDDGESVDSVSSGNYNYFNFTANNGNLKIVQIQSGYRTQMILSNIIVYGVQNTPSKVKINNSFYDNFVYNDITKVLKIQYFYIDMTQYNEIDFTWY